MLFLIWLSIASWVVVGPFRLEVYGLDRTCQLSKTKDNLRGQLWIWEDILQIALSGVLYTFLTFVQTVYSHRDN